MDRGKEYCRGRLLLFQIQWPRKASHIRWHLNRNLKKENSALCIEWGILCPNLWPRGEHSRRDLS